MARKAAVPIPPTPFELMAQRIKRAILAPRSQLERRVKITRLPDETSEDWQTLLDQIDEEETVSLSPQEDGSVLVSWTVPRTD